MDLFADAVSIIDDKGIVRLFHVYEELNVPYTTYEVVGKHFAEAFSIKCLKNSTVMRALQGETIYNALARYSRSDLGIIDYHESVYPIRTNGQVVGVVCISRKVRKEGHVIEISSMDDTEEATDIRSIVGDSPAINHLKAQIRQVAATDSNVLIYGETGTGKELVAQALHNLSARKDKVFYTQNCAALPAQLLEGLFFGTVRGVFTGAVDRPGVMEQISGGTLFLDEINSLDLTIQAKLLKAIEENKVRRLGAVKETPTNIRIVAATNEDPFSCISNGKIREDLFYRIGVVILEIPPLRNRRSDIPALTEHFIELHREKHNLSTLGISSGAMDILQRYNWPGNVRELKNVIESGILFSKNGQITIDSLPKYLLSSSIGTAGTNEPPVMQMHSMDLPVTDDLMHKTLGEIEADIIKRHLDRGSTHTKIAQILGISRQTLISKIKKYGLTKF